MPRLKLEVVEWMILDNKELVVERKDYVIAIDLGSSNVTVAVAEKNAEGLLDLVGISQKPTMGVQVGQVQNSQLVGHSVNEAVSEVEEKLGIRISEAYVGISGEFVQCARYTDHVFVNDSQMGVSEQDVNGLFDRMRNVQAPDGQIIMERIPQNYIVDDCQEVENPVGSFGHKLSSTFNFILCQTTPIQRLNLALKRLEIKILKDVLPDSMVIPESVVSPDEKDEGVAVVNIGGELTDVTILYRNVVRYVATIPMGSSTINRDIRTMGVPEKLIEDLKCKYGFAVADLAPENKLIRVNGRTRREAKDILLRNLATVIEARATDIAELVFQEIQDSGYAERLTCGIVLTGGGAKLKNLDELFRRVTDMEVRIGTPQEGFSDESLEKLDNPSFTTVAGLLLKGIQLGASNVIVDKPEPEPEPQPEPQPVVNPAPRVVTTPQMGGQPQSVPQPPTPIKPQQPMPTPSLPSQGAVKRPVMPSATQQTEQPVERPRTLNDEYRQAGWERQTPSAPSAPVFPKEEPKQEEMPQSPSNVEEEEQRRNAKKHSWSQRFKKAFEKINNSFAETEDENEEV